MKDKRNKALLTGTVTYAIGSFGTKFLNFLIVPLYTYFITPSDLGDYDLLVTTVSLLSPLITMKISDAAYRWIIKEKQNEIPYISATYKLLIRNCIISAIILLLINAVIPIWNCYYFIAILIGDRVLECLQKLLRGLKNQKLFAVSGVIHTAILVLLNLVKVCILKQGVIALLQSSVISIYITIGIILFLEKRLRYVDFSPSYRSEQKEMLQYSIPLVPTTLGWWVMSTSDRYVIKWVLGSAANGIYSVAYKFPSILQMVFTMFNNAWTDMALSQLEKGEKSEQYVKEVFRQLYTLSFSLAFILIPVTKLAMQLLLSKAYKDASVYMGFLYLGTVFQGLSSFCTIGYLQGKKTQGAAKTSLIGAIVNLLIDVLLIRYIGIHAAAISTFLGFFIMWILRMNDIKSVFFIGVNRLHFTIFLLIGVIIAIASIWTTMIIDIAVSIIAIIIFFANNKKIINEISEVIKSKIRT